MTEPKKHPVKVTILNEEYTLRSDASPEDARAIAQYLDRAIREVMTGGHIVDSNRAAILAALRITAELFEARAASKDVEDAMTALSGEVRRLLPPNKRSPVAS